MRLTVWKGVLLQSGVHTAQLCGMNSATGIKRTKHKDSKDPAMVYDVLQGVVSVSVKEALKKKF